jgi:hypothetical protein
MALNTAYRSDAAVGGKTSINSLIVLNIRFIFNHARIIQQKTPKKMVFKRFVLLSNGLNLNSI